MENQSRIRFLGLLLLAGAIAAAIVLLTKDDDAELSEEAPAGLAVEAGCEQIDELPAEKEESFDKPEQVLEEGEAATATVVTSCGEFTVELDTEQAPKTANSFAFLAQEGFYDDTVFHRIAPKFVIQGGDPTGTGEGGPGYTVDEPPPSDTVYRRGVVAMAKSPAEPPGRSGSQFFVVSAPADAGLEPDYALLGTVTEGMDVVDRIDSLGDPATEEPLDNVIIESVTIETSAQEETTAKNECKQIDEPPAEKEESFDEPEQVLEEGDNATATVVTNCGEFTIELDTERAPKTANSFAFLAQEGFYDDTVFHRLVPGFVIQGGDPTGTGTGGPGYSVDEKPPGDLVYEYGIVAMAKSGAEPKGRSGSQFFVVTAKPDAGLPPDYALLGEVTEGMEVAERIAELGDPATGGEGVPTETVVLETVTVEISDGG